MKNRVEWIDGLKGILMIFVIWGHFFPPENIGIWIYSFHMPTFFIISGYLRKDRNFAETLKKKSISLLLPYIVTATISFILGIFIYKGMGMNISLNEMISDFFYLNGSVGWNSPIWFLIVLFELDVFYCMVKKVHQQVILIIFALVLGYFIYVNNIVLPFGLHVFVWASVFYTFGLLMKNTNFKLSKNQVLNWVLFALTLILNFVFDNFQYEITAMYHSQLGIYWIFYVNGIITSYMIIAIFKFMKVNNRFLNLFSRYSLQIMCTHYMFYMFYRILDKLFFKHYLLSYQLVPSLLNLCFCLLAYTMIYKMYNIFKKKQLVLS